MSLVEVVQQACDRIEAACDEIEEALRGTGYVFPRSGIECILREARRQAEWTEEMTETPAAAVSSLASP
jgi:hypothetical protein